MTMINYKSLTGGEVLYLEGVLYLWMPWGVYTLNAVDMKRHGQYSGPREVIVDLMDTENGMGKVLTLVYNDSYDDYELIYKFISGSASCDCIRGEMLYGPTLNYACNKGPNRFIIRKMAIKGEPTNCILTYKGYR
jgi:hypothetical protein